MRKPSDGAWLLSGAAGPLVSGAPALAPSPASLASVFWKPLCGWMDPAWASCLPLGLDLSGLAEAVAVGGGATFRPGAGTEGGGGGAADLISSKGRSFISQRGLGAEGAMATSSRTGEKHCISTCSFQVPSARSGNAYTPWASV